MNKNDIYSIVPHCIHFSLWNIKNAFLSTGYIYCGPHYFYLNCTNNRKNVNYRSKKENDQQNICIYIHGQLYYIYITLYIQM